MTTSVISVAVAVASASASTATVSSTSLVRHLDSVCLSSVSLFRPPSYSVADRLPLSVGQSSVALCNVWVRWDGVLQPIVGVASRLVPLFRGYQLVLEELNATSVTSLFLFRCFVEEPSLLFDLSQGFAISLALLS